MDERGAGAVVPRRPGLGGGAIWPMGAWSSWVALCVLTHLLGGCADGPAPDRALDQPPQRIFVDDRGAQVSLPARPMRVISLFPGLTETVCAVGACDRLVAVDQYSDHPAQVKALPTVGNLMDLDVEAIVALHPDVVVASLYARGVDALRAAGVPVIQVALESWDDVFSSIDRLGTVLGLEEQARQVAAGIQAEVRRVEAQAAASATRPTVYYEVDATPYTVGPGSFVGTLIEKARGDNIIPAELGLFPHISPELVVAKDPQVIIVTRRAEGEGRPVILGRPGWAGLRAVRDGRICELNAAEADRVVRAGPRVHEGLGILVRCIHGAP